MTIQADPAPAPSPRSRVRRALATAAASLGLGAVFVASAVGAVALHLDTAAARRVVCGMTNDLLGSLFEGKIVTDEIDALSLTSVRIRAAVAIDPRDGQVIRASGIEARADVLGMLRDVLLGEGDLIIEIPYIRVEHADVTVEASPSGGVTISDTFTPLPSKAPPKQQPKKAAPRVVRVVLPHIEIGRGWVHGLVAPPRALDADVSRLSGSVRVGPEGVSVDVDQTGLVDRVFLSARASGTADYHLRAGRRVLMWTSFAGQINAVEVSVRGVMDAGHVTASGSAPRVTPQELASLLPGHPFTEPVTATIELDGDVPTFDVSGAIAAIPAGPVGGSVTVEGRLDAGGPLRLEADVTAREVDPRLFGVKLPQDERPPFTGTANAEPRSALTLSAEGRLRAELGGSPRLTVDARTEPTVLLDEAVPAADVHLVWDRGELSGAARLHELGMPVDAVFVVLPGEGGVRFAAQSEIPAIAAAPRLAGPIDGSARVHVEGTLRGDALDARIHGAFGPLRAGKGVALGAGDVEGRLYGPLDALAVDASLSGSAITAGGYSFEAVRARASGKLASPELHATLTDAGDSITASGQLTASTGALRGVALRVQREGQALAGTIARIAPGHGGIEVLGIKLAGDDLGTLEGGFTVQGDDVTGTLRGDGVNLDKVARVLGFPHRIHGVANLDVAIQHGNKGGRSGKLLLELEEGEFSMLTGLSAHLSATMEEDRVKADGLVRLVATEPSGGPTSAAPRLMSAGDLRCEGTIASMRLSRGEGVLSGPLLRPATWTGLTGSAEVAAEDWDLGCLAQIVPAISVWLSDVRGKLTARFGVARAPGERFPSLRALVARTRGLELAGPQGLGDEHPAWESRSIDGQIKGALDGATGKAEASLTLFDGELLGDVSASVDLDLPLLVDHPERRWQTLRASKLTGRLAIPRRPMSSFKTLPSFALGYLPKLAGEVRMDAYADGTLAAPFLAVRARGFGVSYAGRDEAESELYTFPADVDAVLTYDSEHATLDAHVSKGSHEIVTVNAEATAALDVLLGGAPPPGRPRWTGGFRMKLDEVPLGELSPLEESGVAGHVSGVISMSGLGEAPSLTAALDLPDLKIGDDFFFDRGAISLRIWPEGPANAESRATSTEGPANAESRATSTEGPANAESRATSTNRSRGASVDRAIARVRLEAQDGGVIDATGYAGVRWRDGLLPQIDSRRAADISIFAQRFGLAAIQPLTTGVLSKLDGYLDGRLRIGWRRADEGEADKVEADMRISRGVVHIPELGQELREASLHISARDGLVRFDDISAVGASGRVRGWAVGQLSGLSLRGGAGALSIKKGEDLPLTLEGVPLGSAYGDINFTAEMRQGELAFQVSVPTLHITLPATSARNVQSLDDNPEVSLSHPIGPAKGRRSKDALQYALTAALGDIEVEGSGLRLHLTSSGDAPPKIVLADEARVSGDILLSSGDIEVFGKSFEIDRGLVRLRREETSNPYINTTAHWDAPDGTRIFVDYVGLLKPVTQDKLKFRSNPPSSQKDILGRVLFDADPSQAGQDASARQAAGGVAVGVGGELASAQVNAILSGITALRGLSTRFGTTSEGALRTSIVYELDDKLTALASYEAAPSGSAASTTTGSGATPGGAAGQRTSRTEISIDWRFHQNWSLRGTIGVGGIQTGSGILDLLWQHRY